MKTAAPMKSRSEKEKIILAICGILAIVIVPFAVVRYTTGETAAAVLDTALILGIGTVFTYVYFTGKTLVPGYIASAMFLLGTIGTIYIKGSSQVHWAYPSLVVIFYLLNPRIAFIIGSMAILAIIPALSDAESVVHKAKMLLTLFVNLICAFIFANVTNTQSLELKRLMRKDPLTQVGNRGAMEQAIKTVFANYQQSAKTCSALMVDIDHFKNINDTYGHQVGDEILRKVADIIDGNVRLSESVYRYGGEEFLVLARNMEKADAQHLAERLRQKIESADFTNGIKITISIGLSELGDEHDVDAWLRQADQAMYAAKRRGRNRVVSFTDTQDGRRDPA